VLDWTSQGGIPLDSTLADDFSLLCPLQMDFEQVLHRPVEITRVTGQVEYWPSGVYQELISFR
jgi:hypothetical protein